MMLTAIAQGPATLRRLLPLQPLQILTVGLLVATSSACIPLLFGLPLMNAIWLSGEIPVLGKVGTPVLFDLGVYLTVIGVMLLIFLSLAED
jgi:multicomponent Na+:H+ antiporter subunit B